MKVIFKHINNPLLICINVLFILFRERNGRNRFTIQNKNRQSLKGLNLLQFILSLDFFWFKALLGFLQRASLRKYSSLKPNVIRITDRYSCIKESLFKLLDLIPPIIRCEKKNVTQIYFLLPFRAMSYSVCQKIFAIESTEAIIVLNQVIQSILIMCAMH